MSFKESPIEPQEQLTFLTRRIWKHKSWTSGTVATIAKMVQVACKKFKHPVTNLVTFFKDSRIVLVYQQIIWTSMQRTHSIMKGRKNCSTHHNNYKSHSWEAASQLCDNLPREFSSLHNTENQHKCPRQPLHHKLDQVVQTMEICQ